MLQRRASAPLARGLATQASSSATPIASTSAPNSARPRLQQMRENIRELDDFLAADAPAPAGANDKVVFKKGKA